MYHRWNTKGKIKQSKLYKINMKTAAKVKKQIDEQQCKPLAWTAAKKALTNLEKKGEYQNLALLAVGFYTGLRISDILQRKFIDFLKADTITVTEQKTKKERTIQITQTLKNIVQACKVELKKKDQDFIFTNNRYKSNKPITAAAAITRINQSLVSCGFSEDKSGNLSGHTLRKTFALRYYELAANEVGEFRALSELSKILKHSNIEVTRRYICLDKQTQANIFTNFD
jgi:integrase